MALISFWLAVFGSQFLARSFWFAVFGSQFLVRSFWFAAFDSQFLVRSFWLAAFGSQFLVLIVGSCAQCLGITSESAFWTLRWSTWHLQRHELLVPASESHPPEGNLLLLLMANRMGI